MDDATVEYEPLSGRCWGHDEPHSPMQLRVLVGEWCLVQELSASGLHSRISLARGEGTREVLVCAEGAIPVDPEEWWFSGTGAMSLAAHVSWHIAHGIDPGMCAWDEADHV